MPKQRAPEGETRKERFRRVATYRTNRVLDDIRLLGNLSNRSTYDYSEDEVNKIFFAIKKQLEGARAKFKSPKKKEFQL